MNKEFTTHNLNDAGAMKVAGVRQQFDDHLNWLIGALPPGRELALVRTKLEEACFFAVKAVACHPDNQQP